MPARRVPTPTPPPAEFPPFEVHPDTAAVLRAAAARVPSSAVWVFETPSTILAEAALQEVASVLLSPDTRSLDCTSFAPAAERWRVEEVSTLLATLAFAPVERRVVGVWSVDAMDPSCFDRLLVAFEAPPALQLSCWSVRDVTLLPATLASRVTETFRIAPTAAARFDDLARALGMPPTVVSAHGFAELAPIFAVDPARFRAAADLDPAATAFEWLAAVRDAASVIKMGKDVQRRMGASLVDVATDLVHTAALAAAAAGRPCPAVVAAVQRAGTARRVRVAPSAVLIDLFDAAARDGCRDWITQA